MGIATRGKELQAEPGAGVSDRDLRSEEGRGPLPDERWARGLEHTVDAVALLDATGRHLYVNESYLELTGRSDPEALLGRPWSEVFPGEELQRLREQAAVSIRKAGGSWRGEATAGRSDGSRVLLDLSLTRLEGGRVLLLARDVSEEKRLRERLERMAYYDPLTGLANRRLLREKAGQALALAQRRGHLVGLLYLDLNSFKELNDSLGHSAGDQALVEVARRLEHTTREADTAARVGGDEFAVLLGEVDDEEGAVQAAARVVAGFGEPFHLEGHSIRLEAGIGLALYPRYASDFEELIRQADLAMYGSGRAKEAGVRIYRPDRDSDTPRTPGLLEELHRALRHYRFELHYQPVRTVREDRLVGAEALLRWPHPRLGTLAASKFLPLIEKPELLRRLDRWVLASAAFQLEEWARSPFGGWVAVHLSPASCRDPELIGHLERVLERAGEAVAERLLLLLPGSALGESGDRAWELARAAGSLGVRVAVTDFHPSALPLERLRRLRPSIVALDPGLVGMARSAPTSARLLRTAVEAGHGLDASVLARAVERSDQHRVLADAGCDMAQGFLVGWSMPPARFLDSAAGSRPGPDLPGLAPGR